MKKIYFLFIFLFILSTTGCIKRDTLEDIDIYTTIYPITYITEKLYGDHSNIFSIYPAGINPEDYELTEKQIEDFSDSSLVIFNGLTKEKDYVISMYKNNNNIKIIDSTLSMEYTNGYEEMWLDPSNYLMMIQNIKTGFKQYITNHYLKNEIEENYEKLRLDISSLDAKFKLMAENSEDRNIVIANDCFKFLSKYGLNVYSLEENDNLTEKNKDTIKKLIKSGSIKYIFVTTEEVSDTVQSIINETGVEVLKLHNLTNLEEIEIDDNLDYLSIMNKNLELLKQEVY